MNYEINRVYRFIIEEVCKSVEEESIVTNIDSHAIKELRTGWYEKVAEYTDVTNVSNLPREINHLNFNDKYNEYDNCSDSFDDTDSTNSLENNCDDLFMCLYIKVNKSKNKWKCHFKDGFVNIGPIDFCFSSAQGDLQW